MEIFFIITVVFIILILVSYSKTPARKGLAGEKAVNRVLKKAALIFGGLEFMDLMIEDAQATAQIDNVLLTQRALYVIEMKNYSGMIFGSESQKSWTMTIRHVNKRKSKSGRRYTKTHISKHSFYNPILQNATHIRKLRSVCALPDSIPIFNIVVFGNDADLSRLKKPESVYIEKVHQLFYLIEHLENMHQDSISLKMQIEIVDTITDCNITEKQKRIEHVKRLKEKHQPYS